MKQIKSNNAITLIALIITVIVLLILAGVAINAVIGKNGLINKATTATDEYQKASIKEKVQMSIASSYMKENGRKPALEGIMNDLIKEGITTEVNCNKATGEFITNDGYTAVITDSASGFDVIVGGKYDGEKKDILPPKPFIPTATVTENSITLAGSTTDAEETVVNLNSGIKAYYFSIDNGATWVTNSNPLTTSYTFTDLSSGTEYKLKMKAVDNSNNERITETVKASTKNNVYAEWKSYISTRGVIDSTLVEDSGIQKDGNIVTIMKSGTYTFEYAWWTAGRTHSAHKMLIYKNEDCIYTDFATDGGKVKNEVKFDLNVGDKIIVKQYTDNEIYPTSVDLIMYSVELPHEVDV